MHRKLKLSLAFLLIVLVAGVIIFVIIPGCIALFQGQTAGNFLQTYTSVDGALTFQYPQGWYEETLGDGRVILENMPPEKLLDSTDAVRLEIDPPTTLASLTMLTGGRTPADLVRFTVTAGNLFAGIFAAPGLGTRTPSPFLTVTPLADVPVSNFTVNGRSAAWTIQSTTFAEYDLATMIVFVDVGERYVVCIQASPYLHGGGALLNRYQQTILAIAGTIRYAAAPTPTSNVVDLPQTFTGTVGGWQMGDITFNYPADWYTIGFVTAFIQNTQAPLNQQALQSGQMQAAIIDPASNQALIKDWKEVVDCTANGEGVTPLTVLQKQSPTTSALQTRVAQVNMTFDTPESTIINGKDAATLRIHQNNEEVLMIEIDLGNGNVAGLMAFAPEGEMSRYEATLKAIVGTFSYKPKAGCNPPTSRPAAVLTGTASHVTPSPSPTTFLATAVPGEKIAFTSARDKAGWQIFTIDTNGQNRQQLTNLSGLYGPIALSPDGRHIAFILFPNNAFLSLSLYVMNADGSDAHLLSDNVQNSLVWQPDNRHLIFTSKRSGNQQAYRIAIDGTDLRQITFGAHDVYSVTLSPDGQRLIFGRDDYSLYEVSIDGTGEYRLPNTNADGVPAWSPDGKYVAFSSSRTRNENLGELFIMNSDGSQVRQLTNKLTIPSASTAPTKAADDWYALEGIDWSPNSRHITFITKKNGVLDAFVIDPDGTNLHHVASDLMGGLSWSPDSQHLTYSAGPIGQAQIFVADADGSHQYPLPNSNPMDTSPIWLPSVAGH